jgi:hypothetical protein
MVAFAILARFGYFVYTGFMVTEFAEQILRCPLYTIFNFIGFHSSI